MELLGRLNWVNRTNEREDVGSKGNSGNSVPKKFWPRLSPRHAPGCAGHVKIYLDCIFMPSIYLICLVYAQQTQTQYRPSIVLVQTYYRRSIDLSIDLVWSQYRTSLDTAQTQYTPIIDIVWIQHVPSIYLGHTQYICNVYLPSKKIPNSHAV